jgi:hypothetical protein
MSIKDRLTHSGLGCSCAIILAPTLIAVLIAVALFRQQLFPSQPAPDQLPTLPVRAVKIAGVYTGGFYEANPYIQASDGQLYRLNYASVEQPWEPTAMIADLDTGIDCPRNSQTPLDNAGTIVDCKTVQVLGEWCPGPIVSFAVTESGEVWRHDHVQPCTFAFSYALVIFLAVAFVIGLLLALSRKVVLRFT